MVGGGELHIELLRHAQQAHTATTAVGDEAGDGELLELLHRCGHIIKALLGKCAGLDDEAVEASSIDVAEYAMSGKDADAGVGAVDDHCQHAVVPRGAGVLWTDVLAASGDNELGAGGADDLTAVLERGGIAVMAVGDRASCAARPHARTSRKD